MLSFYALVQIYAYKVHYTGIIYYDRHSVSIYTDSSVDNDFRIYRTA